MLKLRFPHSRLRAITGAGAIVCVAVVMLGTGLTSPGAGDLQSQIAAKQSAASSLRSQIAAESASIRQTAGGVQAAARRLASLQAQLDARENQLKAVQLRLLQARDRLVQLENRLQAATRALSANLVAAYEGDRPDVVTVILESRGFTDMLNRISFLRRIGRQDAGVVSFTRAVRRAVAREAAELAKLEARDRQLAEQVLTQRNQVAALKVALLRREISLNRTRSSNRSKLHTLSGQLATLEAKAAAQARAAAATGNANVGGIAIDTGGMVQPPPGAPPAVAQVIAAGNAIATLPYVWGGGHGSFQANGYDCSGSVSYALAAAGLVSSPMTSGAFESWGAPGPGRWITVYANAGHVWMEVAGWRFDTVALATSGTRWSQGGGEFAGFVVRHPPGL